MDTSSPSATPRVPLADAPGVDPAVLSFLTQVRDGYRAPLPGDVVSDHLRLILGEAAKAPAAPALRSRLVRYGRRVAAVGAVKLALTATAAAAATGTGLAATGNLPAPAQTAVAGVAQLVGVTLPTPPVDTPGDRSDAEGQELPGIGEGGVPALIEDGGELPGNTGTAPGLHKDEGRPVTPAEDHRPDAPAQPGNPDRGADAADDRPAPPAPAGADTVEDAPANEAPANEAPAAERPAPPQGDGAATDAGPPADRPEPAGGSRGGTD